MSWLDWLLWRMFRTTRLFDYWYKRFLTELLFDLETFDIESGAITAKYRTKLERMK